MRGSTNTDDSPEGGPKQIKQSTLLLGQLNLESPTEIHFWMDPKIPSTRLAKDLVDKICPILQYLVEHVTCMYLTPSLYVKNKGSTRSETTQPNWNGGFSCCKEPAVELHLPPRIPPLQPPPRRKGRRGVPPGARPFGPIMGTPGVAVGSMEKLRWKKLGFCQKRLEPNIRRKHMRSWNQKLCFMFLLHVHRICNWI